jgi:hypothetical protein
MPTPGFPDWLNIGAIVMNITTDERLAITSIRFQPSPHPERQAGSYAIQLNQLDEDIPPRPRVANGPAILRAASQAVPYWTVINLPELLEHYRWTGEYFDENEHLVSEGTTMPVTMHMAALRPFERIHVQGSAAHDGEYVISSVTNHLHRSGGGRGLDLSLVDPASVPSLGTSLPAHITLDMFMQTQDQEHTFEEIVMDEVSMGDAPELGIPRVEDNQVWLLPSPNEGLWRTTFTSGPRHILENHPQVTLTHTRERDRVMRCPATWLVNNAVRHEPRDPRTNTGQQIALGQIWEFDPRHGSRYRRFPRWRVHTIDERAGRIMLMAADGSGKRIYLTPAKILEQAQFAGDGVPRRTAFQRVLEDDDGE